MVAGRRGLPQPAHRRPLHGPRRSAQGRPPDHRYAARAAGDGCRGAREGGRRRGARGEGARHPGRAGPRGARSAVDGRRSHPGRGHERRGSCLGGPVPLRRLLRATTGRGARMSSAVVSRSPRSRPPSGVVDDVDRKVLLALQALVVGLPLCLGGHQPWAVAVSSAVVLVLLAVTIRARRRRAVAPHPPGIVALAGLVALAMATTLSLPPAMLGLVAPATAHLYAEMLPGWPGSGGWTVWRPLAIDSYGVWAELSRLSIGLGAFLVTVAYPWRAAVEGEDARAVVFDRLLLTLLAAGALLAGLGLLSEATGNGRGLWITGAPTLAGRVSGPFVNPNPFAAGLPTPMPAAPVSAVATLGLACARAR